MDTQCKVESHSDSNEQVSGCSKDADEKEPLVYKAQAKSAMYRLKKMTDGVGSESYSDDGHRQIQKSDYHYFTVLIA